MKREHKSQPVSLPRVHPVTREPIADSPTREPERSSRYMAFIRKMDCCNCGRQGPSDPHHVGREGMSQKVDDFRCVPLCREPCHGDAELGRIERLWLEYNVARCLLLFFKVDQRVEVRL